MNGFGALALILPPPLVRRARITPDEVTLLEGRMPETDAKTLVRRRRGVLDTNQINARRQMAALAFERLRSFQRAIRLPLAPSSLLDEHERQRWGV